MEIAWAAAMGFVAGTVHVVSGPDHLAAVLPFAVKARKQALRIGFFWGIGHGAGVLALGALFMVLRAQAPIEAVSRASEALVGVLLVGLGIWAVRRSRLIVVHQHPHTHDDGVHHHHHVHINDPTVDDERHRIDGQHEAHHHSTLGFGFIHGLAGVGHLVVASPILAFGWAAAAVYLTSYLASGVMAMTAVALTAGALVRRPAWVPTALRTAGMGSVAVGLFWVANIALA